MGPDAACGQGHSGAPGLLRVAVRQKILLHPFSPLKRFGKRIAETLM
jgi:hypothetical protein